MDHPRYITLLHNHDLCWSTYLSCNTRYWYGTKPHAKRHEVQKVGVVHKQLKWANEVPG